MVGGGGLLQGVPNMLHRQMGSFIPHDSLSLIQDLLWVSLTPNSILEKRCLPHRHRVSFSKSTASLLMSFIKRRSPMHFPKYLSKQATQGLQFIFTARKRSLGQGNVFRSCVGHSVHGGSLSGCLVPCPGGGSLSGGSLSKGGLCPGVSVEGDFCG